jgi:DNA-binding NarL/FixJ family response regulator
MAGIRSLRSRAQRPPAPVLPRRHARPPPERPLEVGLQRESQHVADLRQRYPGINLKLSAREHQILMMIVHSVSLTEIGTRMFISVKTVSTYRTLPVAARQS